MIGWLALARAVRRASASLVVGAGVILGLATALKLTNLLYLLATLPLIAFIAAPIFARVRYAVIFGVGAAFGFLAGGVTWWIQVWRALGNPFFPLFNQYFRSPYFTTSPLLADRFIPDSWWLALWRPFAMCDPTNMIHEELRSPDVRYAALLILALVLFVLKAWRRTKGSHLLAAEMEDDAASPVGRTFIALALSFGIAWTLWLSTSANSRYFLPMSSVAAVLIAGLLQRLARLEARAFAYPLLLIAICQGFGLGMGTQYRWNPAPWVAQWLDVDVPQRLLTERDLYLTIGVQSNAFIAAYVHPRSGFINFAGGYTLPSSGPSGEKVRSLLARYAPFWRVMIDGDQIHPPESGRSPNEKGLNTRLARFNLKVDPTDCERITVKGVRTEPRKRFIVVTGSADADNDDPELTYLLSCRVVSADDARSRLLSGQKTADTILDRVEDACPRLFQPKGLSAEYTGYVWQRDYLNTDLRVWIGQGWVNFVDLNRGEDSIAIGRETDWIRGPLSLDCGRSNGHYFAHVIAR
ncbi:MAG: hypothetical protein ABSF50_19060 [Burkholderiaceae bacterium]